MKFCKDCRWLHWVPPYDDFGKVCYHKFPTMLDVVTGDQIPTSLNNHCRAVRQSEYLCGIEAHWFEPKNKEDRDAETNSR